VSTTGGNGDSRHCLAQTKGGTLKSLGNGKLTTGFDAECRATREVLDRIGDKWSVLLVVSLSQGPQRFNQLKRDLDGISQRVLTVTLRALERDGLVLRTVHPTNPPQVEYELTSLGKTLLKPVSALAIWAQEHRESIYRSRERYARSRSTSHGSGS